MSTQLNEFTPTILNLKMIPSTMITAGFPYSTEPRTQQLSNYSLIYKSADSSASFYPLFNNEEFRNFYIPIFGEKIFREPKKVIINQPTELTAISPQNMNINTTGVTDNPIQTYSTVNHTQLTRPESGISYDSYLKVAKMDRNKVKIIPINDEDCEAKYQNLDDKRPNCSIYKENLSNIELEERNGSIISSESVKRKVLHKFTQKEDEMLLALAKQYGEGRWAEIAKQIPGLNRKQVRDRYVNYLKESRSTSEFTEKEDQEILKFINEVGKKWCELSGILKGRTPIMLKNRYYSNLRYKDRAKAVLSKGRRKKARKNI